MTDRTNYMQRRRILYVVDSLYWITATIARQISDANEWIEPTVCSESVLTRLLHANLGKYPGQVDLVHFMTPHCATRLMHLFRSTTPCVVTMHHIEDEHSVDPLAAADAIMTVCSQWHDVLLVQGIPSDKCVMIPNSVDVNLFKPAQTEQKRINIRSKFGIPEDSICIGFSGKQSSNTYGRKGTETLLAAMESLSNIRNSSLVILGPGWGNLVKGLRERGISCIHIPFLMDRRKVAQLYQAIDFYWVTSRIEGGPVPLLEAMSSGAVCVSSPVGVALDAIEQGANGFIAPFDAPDVYRNVTMELTSNIDKRLQVGLAARQTIVDRFSSTETPSAAAELYRTAETHFFRRCPSREPRSLLDRTERARNGKTMQSRTSVPRKVQRWMTAAEHVYFMNYLVSVGATNPARRVAWRAIVADPFSVEVWSKIMRAHFPITRLLRYSYERANKLLELCYNRQKF